MNWLKANYNKAMLFTTALVWGLSFVFIAKCLEHMGPFLYNALRCYIGAAVLGVVIWINHKKHPTPKPVDKKHTRGLWFGGTMIGIALFVAGQLQQFGVMYTDVGRAGFITACYVVLVPIIGMIIGRKCPNYVWGGAALIVLGLYLLSGMDMEGGVKIGLGDGLTFICAVMFAVHILVIDHFVDRYDTIELSCIQFLVSALLSTVACAIFERPDWSEVMKAIWPMLGSGVLACGVGHTFQIVGQKGMNPAIASVILSLESVFALIFGCIIKGETRTSKELIGCACIFLAVIFVEAIAPMLVKKFQKKKA